MNYRFDKRSKKKFSEDIMECSRIERKLMEAYVKWLNDNKRSDKPYSFEDHGVDNSGEFLEDDEVNCNADFLLCREGQTPRKIDIKFCRQDRLRFHLKVNQLKRYVENDVCIVNFMGVDTDKRRFTILTPAMMKALLLGGKRVVFWHKDCIRIENSEVTWQTYA